MDRVGARAPAPGTPDPRRHRRGAIVTQPQRRPGAGSPEPVLITDAARSYEEDLAARKKRYGLMMGMRVPCMVLAAVFYQTPWLAVTLLGLSIPLPGMAVLIANDRRPIKREDGNRYESDRTALEARPHPAIDPPPGGGAGCGPGPPPVIHAPPGGGVVVGGRGGGGVIEGAAGPRAVRHAPGRAARRAG